MILPSGLPEHVADDEDLARFLTSSGHYKVRAGEPPPRHADIVGWPWSKEDPDFGKAQQKELAALIAQRAGESVRF